MSDKPIKLAGIKFVDQGCVEVAEELLSQAKAGTVKGICMVVVTRDGSWWIDRAGGDFSALHALGAVARLQYRIQSDIDGECQ